MILYLFLWCIFGTIVTIYGIYHAYPHLDVRVYDVLMSLCFGVVWPLAVAFLVNKYIEDENLSAFVVIPKKNKDTDHEK